MSTTSGDGGKPSAGEDSLRDAGTGIDGPRLTPQGRTDPDIAGEDKTSPQGGAKTGQSSKAEG